MSFEIIYTPRVENEVVVAKFETLEEATNHLETIKHTRPNAYRHHRIEEVREQEWLGQDSGKENFV